MVRPGTVNNRRILYVGPLDAGGTCSSRLEGLRELGHDVVPLNTLDHLLPWPWWIRAAQNRLLIGPGIWGLNRAIEKTAVARRPEIVWIDKGIHVWASTLKRIRRETGSFILHHNTDDIRNPRHNFSLYFSALHLYDAHFTSNRFNIEELREMGARYVGFSDLGYDHRRFQPRKLAPEERAKWAAEVFFIGHWEPQTECFIQVLAEASVRVVVRGPGWERATTRLPAGTVHGNGVYGDEYVRAINGGTIGLGVVSEWNRNETAGRLFEIPACGTLLLAQRNSITSQLYRDEEEVELFSSENEMVAKVRLNLKDQERARRIGAAGRVRCLNSGYSWKDRVGEILSEIEVLGA